MRRGTSWTAHAVAGWNRFWFAPLDPLPAALFRIGLATVLLVQLAAEAHDWTRYYGAEGLVAARDPALAASPLHAWSLVTLTDGVVPLDAFWWIGIVAGVALLVGWWTRTAAAVLFLLRGALVFRAPQLLSGEDVIARLLLLPSCFAALGSAWAVDARWWRARPRPAAWPVRLVQVHVALIYAFTQLQKFRGDPSWISGDAMYWAMVNETWSRWPWPALFYRRGVAAGVTWGSFLVEAAFPVLAWFRRTRVPIVAALIAMHLTIALALRGVELFTLVMLCPLVLFLRTSDLRLRSWAARPE